VIPCVPSPFVGPRPFEASDREIFFGRQAETTRLVDHLMAFPCTLLYSRSGFGKSSLVSAGLRPRLEAEGWVVLTPVRFGSRGAAPADPGNPIAGAALDAWGADAADYAQQPAIPRFLARHRSAEPGVAVIFDQFEEFFTFGTAEQRVDFFNQLREAHTQIPGLRILFVMREEFLADLDPYARRLPKGLANRMRLERLNREAAIEALRSPLERVRVGIADDAVDALVASLTREHVRTASGATEEVEGNFAEPVYLQIVAHQLWAALPPGVHEVTLRDVEGLQDKDPLRAFYTQCVREASEQTGVRVNQILRWCSDVLVTRDGTRAIVYRGAEETAGMKNSVVDVLQSQHVIRGETRAGAIWLELAHDQFVRPVNAAKAEWDLRMAGPLERARAWEKAAREWALSGGPGLGPAEVNEAEHWMASDSAADIGFSQDLRDFIAYSRRRNTLSQRERNKLQAQRALLVVGLIAAVGFAWWAWEQKVRGDRLAADNLTTARNEQKTQRDLDALKTQNAEADAERAKKEAAAAVENTDKLRALNTSLDRQTRLATAYQLKSKVQELSQRYGLQLDDQLKLNLAYLAGAVTREFDNTISSEAQTAMRLALSPIKVKGYFGINGGVSANGSRYLDQTDGIVRIYSLPDARLIQSIDLRGVTLSLPTAGKDGNLMGSPIFATATLHRNGTRLHAYYGGHDIMLDVSKNPPARVFDQQFDPATAGPYVPVVDGEAKRLAAQVGSEVLVWDTTANRQIARIPIDAQPTEFDDSGEHLMLKAKDGSIAISTYPFDSVRNFSKYAAAALFKNGLVVADNDNQVIVVDADGKAGAPRKAEFSGIFDFCVLPSGSSVMLVGEPPPTGGRGPGPSAMFVPAYSVEIMNLQDGSHWELNNLDLRARPVALSDTRIITQDRSGLLHIWTRGVLHDMPIEVVTLPRTSVSLASTGELAAVSADGSVSLLSKNAPVPAPSPLTVPGPSSLPPPPQPPPPLYRPLPVKLPTTGATSMLVNSPNRVLIAYHTGEIRLGNALTGEVERIFPHGPGLFDIAVNDAWTLMASSDSAGVVKIWRLDRDTPLHTIAAHHGRVRALALDAEGGRLATAGPEREIRLWSAASGQRLKTLGADAAVQALVFSGKDGLVAGDGLGRIRDALIAGDELGRMRVWDLGPDTSEAALMRSSFGAGFGRVFLGGAGPRGAVLDFAMNPKRTLLAVAGADHTVRLYDLTTGAETLSIANFESPVRRVAFDPSGNNVLGIDEAGNIRIDPISPSDLMAAIRARIQKLLTHEECMEYAPAVPSACPPK
jgi:WD40 repeat protein